MYYSIIKLKTIYDIKVIRIERYYLFLFLINIYMEATTRATMIIDLDYLKTNLEKTGNFSLRTKTDVDNLFNRIYSFIPIDGKNLSSPANFFNKHLVFSEHHCSNYADIFPLFSEFIIHANRSNNQCYYCNSCRNMQKFTNMMIADRVIVSLAETIITTFNKNVSGVTNSLIILLGSGKKYESILELAKKYGATIFLVANERTSIEDKFIDIKNIVIDTTNYREKIKEAKRYCLEVKILNENIYEKTFEGLIEGSGFKIIDSEWKHNPQDNGWIAKMFFSTKEIAINAREFVFLFIECR